MSTSYLLPCACGKNLSIQPSQAGDRVRCECGAELEVPPLRQLRELPPDTAADSEAASGGDWALHNGVLTAGLLVAAVLAGLGLWWWATEPPMPESFNAEATAANVEMVLDRMTPAQAYSQWVNFYLTTDKLQPVGNPRVEAAIDYVRHARLVRNTLWIAAGVVAVLAVLLYTQLKPKARA